MEVVDRGRRTASGMADAERRTPVGALVPEVVAVCVVTRSIRALVMVQPVLSAMSFQIRVSERSGEVVV
jgi:hypothetical protein